MTPRRFGLCRNQTTRRHVSGLCGLMQEHHIFVKREIGKPRAQRIPLQFNRSNIIAIAHGTQLAEIFRALRRADQKPRFGIKRDPALGFNLRVSVD